MKELLKVLEFTADRNRFQIDKTHWAMVKL